MTDNFKEIGSLFGREGAGAGFAKQTDKESFTYAFAWPEGDTWATLTGYLNLDEQPEEYVRRVLQDGGFRSDRDDTMIAVLADVDEDGFPLIAALRPGGNAVSEGRSVGGTIVCSFYGKPENYFRFKMQQMPQRVLYQDIEKGRELDARAKLQLFGGNIASPDLDRRIIRPPECIVKLRADTPQMETHGRETSRVRRESRDMASGRAALDAGRRAETARVTERHINSNLK